MLQSEKKTAVPIGTAVDWLFKEVTGRCPASTESELGSAICDVFVNLADGIIQLLYEGFVIPQRQAQLIVCIPDFQYSQVIDADGVACILDVFYHEAGDDTKRQCEQVIGEVLHLSPFSTPFDEFLFIGNMLRACLHAHRLCCRRVIKHLLQSYHRPSTSSRSCPSGDNPHQKHFMG